jgi:ribosomal protein S6--L-glutamate ligase
MRLCFIIEEKYRGDTMPTAVARQLSDWGHLVQLLHPAEDPAELSADLLTTRHDAWVLKTVSDGPGLSLLESAAALGQTTVNAAHAVRSVRDKAVAAAIAERHGLPVPRSWFAARPAGLRRIPGDCYPLVVKPALGSANRSVRLLPTPADLAAAEPELAADGHLLAQPYVPNHGADLKVYAIGAELHATRRRSTLHPELPAEDRSVPLPDAAADLTARVGRIYGLDLYGVDLVEGPDGWSLLDVNDFPSFRHVPDAVARVAREVLRLAAAGPAEPRPLPIGTGLGVPGSRAPERHRIFEGAADGPAPFAGIGTGPA